MELTSEQKQVIINRKIAGYKQSLYSLELDFKVAEMLEQESSAENIKKDIKTTMKVIDYLQNLEV